MDEFSPTTLKICWHDKQHYHMLTHVYFTPELIYI